MDDRCHPVMDGINNSYIHPAANICYVVDGSNTCYIHAVVDGSNTCYFHAVVDGQYHRKLKIVIQKWMVNFIIFG